MGRIPKSLGLAAAVALAVRASYDANEEDTKGFETTVSSGRTPSAELTDEGKAIKAYIERCIHTQGINTLDFTADCDRAQDAAVSRLGLVLSHLQESGKLEELTSIENCKKFHWADKEDRSNYGMLAAPAPHSHFDFENWDCVMGLYVYTDPDANIACKLSTVCRDEDDRAHTIGGYFQEECEVKPFNAADALDKLDKALEQNRREAKLTEE